MRIVKGFLFTLALIIAIPLNAQAKVYVCMSKTTGEPQGTVDINPENVGQWASSYTMVEADESYRGLMGFEVKYENKKLRKSTEKEISDYKQAEEAEMIAKQKENALATLGLSQHDLDKVKALPGVE